MAKIRISSVSFKCGTIKSFDDFADHATRLVSKAASNSPDFVVFPELFTNELMTFFDDDELDVKFRRIPQYTEDYMNLFGKLAKEKALYIVAGSHVKEVEGNYYNTSHVFTPDDQVLEQRKAHLFPPERAVQLTPGDNIAVFQTEKAKISILICYDLEFPEVSRIVTLKGAEILFSPSATLDDHGYWRVRHCGQARCIEDQVFVVHCSLLGDWGVPGLEFWGASSILTPCDKGFPEKGIAAEGPFNEESVVTAEVDTEMLYEIRQQGAATTLKDRRWDMIEDLYRLESRERK